ncbi:MAG TPA: hypothetical protein VK393_11045 [Nocardioidaceae bacterium]|nr:hypothetical protein [Nocardioidaceae bacterium]
MESADQLGRARLYRLIAEVWAEQGGYDRAESALHEAENALGSDDQDRGVMRWQTWLDVQFVLATTAYMRGDLAEHDEIVNRVRPKLLEHSPC